MSPRPQGLSAVVCACLIAVAWAPVLRAQEGPRPSAPPSQADILAEVTRLKGEYKADANGRDKRPWAVTLSGEEVTDRHVEMLQHLDGLLELHLIKAKVTDAGLAPLAKYKTLRSVRLYDCAVGDKGVEHLVQVKGLVELKLSVTKVTDAGLEPLAKAKGLKVLDLSSTAVTDDGLKHLAALTGLQRLDLGSTKVTGPGLAHLKDLGALRELNLYQTPVKDTDLAHLKPLAALDELRLSRTKVTDAGLKTIGQLKLTVLELNNTAVTDDAVPIILRMPTVRTVHVKGTQISPKLLKELDSSRVKFFN